MSRILLFIGLACLVGCSSKQDVRKQSERYLYFTSNFPSSVYWEIMTTFDNKSTKLFCKDFSMGSGKMEQSTKYEHFSLNRSGDTLKVPLFWTKADRCDWEISDISIGAAGRRIQMRQIYLKDKIQVQSIANVIRPIPDSLVYKCNYDSEENRLNCESKNNIRDSEFLLNDSLRITPFRIDLEIF